ncbi:MAG: PAS domain S-box protein [Thermodesulfobacteriota bacterium]|nr:PAS domain S-box protein [Thermodesulfobacteriota bacterium]
MLIESTNSFVFSVDADGIFDFVNQFWTERIGYPAEEIIGTNGFDLITADTIAEVEKNVAKVVKGDFVGNIEFRSKTKEGGFVDVLVNLAPVLDSSGKIVRIMGTGVDITERKQAEEALRESEARLESIFRAAPIGIGMVVDRVLMQVNTRLCEMTGYSAGELLGQDARMLYPTQEDYEYVGREKYNQIRDHGTGTVETRFKRKDGKVIDVLLSSTALDRNDLSKGVTFTALDITQRKQAEEILQQSVREMTVLNALGNQVSSSLSLDQVMDLSLQGIFDAVEPHLALIFLRDKDRLVIRGEKHKNPKLRHRYSIVHRVGECLCGLAVSEKTAVYSKNINDDPRCTWSECKEAGLTSFAALPLRSADEMIGVIGLGSVTKRDFSKEATFLETASSEITIGLQNAILHEQLRHHATGLAREITERELAEERLRESEGKLRAVLDSTPFPIGIADLQDNRIIYWSRSALALFGHPAPTNTSEWYQMAYPDPDYRREVIDRWKPFLEIAHESGSAVNAGEYQVTCSDGSVRICELYATFLPENLIVTFNDITERKRAVESLQQSEKRFKSTFEQAAVGIAHVARDGTWLRVNQRLCDIVGYTKRELLEKTFQDITHPDDLEADFNYARQMLNNEIETFSMEKRYIRKEGSIVWINLTVSLVQAASGEPDYFISVIEDITERKLAEEALRSSEGRYRTLFDTSRDALMTLAPPSWKFTSGNPACIDMFGVRDEADFVSRGPWEYSPELQPDGMASQDRAKEMIETAMRNGSHFFEWTHRRLDGKDFPATVLLTRVVLSGHGQLQATVRDITEQRRLEGRLGQAQKMEAIGTLAGGIAHDFNNILAAILGYTEMAIESTSEQPTVQKDLGEVLKASVRAKDLVYQILAFSRQTEHETEPVKVKLVVKEATRLLRASIPTTIEMVHRVLSDSSVMADPTQIHQVVVNLCTNAAHAMEEKGGVLEVSLEEVLLDADFVAQHPNVSPGLCVRLTVSDTGHGMDSSTVSRVFEPYFSTKEKGEGTGLGLSVVHGIVKSLGGTVTVYSEPGEGTTFHVYLPVIEREAEPEITTEEVLPTGSETILFVDDELPLANLGKQMLVGLGYRVVTRTSSLEALEAFRREPGRFDLVVTDMTMPTMTGDQLATELIKIRSDIPVVLCTGFSKKISEQKAHALGVRAFVMKPFLKRQMAETIRSVLDEK